jgi:hypothetical protein
MTNLLNRPHPFYDDTKLILVRMSIIGILVAFILIVFQPFGTDSFHHPHKKIYLAGHGLIAFLSFGFTLLGLPFLFPKYFDEDKWVVWKQITVLALGFFLSFIGSYFYMNWFFNQIFHWGNFMNFLPIVGVIGLFPGLIITLLDNNNKLKKHRQIAEDLTEKIAPAKEQVELISLTDENENPALEIPLRNLVYIQSASNYVEVHFLEDGNLKKTLIRNTLSNMEKQVPFDHIKKCHRSYMANLNLIEKITGNAQGYRLHFPFSTEITVPVSRSKGKELLAIISRT